MSKKERVYDLGDPAYTPKSYNKKSNYDKLIAEAKAAIPKNGMVHVQKANDIHGCWRLIERLVAALNDTYPGTLCDVCLGEGVALGRKCGCGGTGKVIDLLHYLRSRLLESQQERDELLRICRQIQRPAAYDMSPTAALVALDNILSKFSGEETE